MKSFRELTEDLFTEGGEMYPADEMTMKELKIACYAAQNILDRLEDGTMIQRWQISAIVKAKEELASVYTSMSADENDDDEWEDDYEEEPMYVGFEYPRMYGEEVNLDEAPLLGPQGPIHRAASMNQSDREYAMQRSFKNKWKSENPGKTWPGYEKAGFKSPYDFKEELDFKVSVDGLPDMYVKGNSPAEVKTNLRKVIKKPDSIQSVDRVTQAMLKKIFRDKAMGKEEMEEGYNDPEYIRRAIPALKNAVEFHKDMMKDHDKKSVKGSAEYVKAHSAAANAHKEAAERHRIAHAQLSMGSKDVEYYVKPARELGAHAEKLSNNVNKLKEEVQLDEVEGSVKRNRELYSTGRINKDEFDRRMGYGKYKKKGPAGVGPLGNSLYKNLVKSAVSKNEELEEGYNDPIHRKYISDAVHEYVSKDDPKHDKIVDHLHQAKNFGNKTVDSLETHAEISIGAAKRITKAVAEHMKANFGAPGKTQTQAQRIDSYLKQKWVKPR